MKSIIQDEEKCFLCGSTDRLASHHIFGGSNRQLSEKFGLKIYLCKFHHTGDERGCQSAVHFNKELMQKIHEIGQTTFEKTHTREDFIRIFGRNYFYK